MRKTLCMAVLMLIIFAGAVLYVFGGRHDFAMVSCIDTAWTIKNELETEDMAMYLVYQLARRNIVKVTVGDSAGSGIIWKIDDDIVIASNKHLLMKDVKAKITFCNGENITADIIGYSQQYDIGYVRVGEEHLAGKLFRDIYNAVPLIYPFDTEEDKKAFLQNYGGTKIMQVGVDADSIIVDYSLGTVKELTFLPLFNTNIVVSNCYSKAGMSGGGIFDGNGRLLGMISGGDVPDSSTQKEAEITYSIPAGLIEQEYEKLSN